MHVKNLRPDEVEIPNVGVVDGGGTIEVSDELGKSLCEQTDNWAKVPATKKVSD